MHTDTKDNLFLLRKQLCTHHVGSGRKEDRGILGSVNTARLAPYLRGFVMRRSGVSYHIYLSAHSDRLRNIGS